MRAANLRWLAGYRHPWCLDGERADSLRQVFAQALPLLEGARTVGDPIAVLPTLYQLIRARALVADLDSAPPASRWPRLPALRCHCPVGAAGRHCTPAVGRWLGSAGERHSPGSPRSSGRAAV